MTLNQRGAMALSTSMFLFVLNDICVKTLTAYMPTSQIMAIRGGFACLFALIWIYQAKEFNDFRPFFKSKIALARGASEGLVAYLFISAVAFIPLGDITAIVLVAPLLITALSVPILGESVGWRRWIAICVGFVGMLFVIKPAGNGLGFWGMLAFLSAVIVALRDVVTKKIDSQISSKILMFSACFAVFALGLALYPTQKWINPSLKDWAMLTFAAATVMLGNYYVAVAFRNVDVSFVSPFRYTVILWALLAGFIFWGDKPDIYAFFGTLLIILSGLYTLYRERKKKILQ